MCTAEFTAPTSKSEFSHLLDHALFAADRLLGIMTRITPIGGGSANRHAATMAATKAL